MKTLLILIALLSVSTAAPGIEGVPFVKQESSLCGPASLASVMSYYGTVIDQRIIANSVYCEGLRGTLISDLENFARHKGFNTRLTQGSIDDLKTLIAEGKPVIVLVDMGFWVVSRPHYLVVTGFGSQEVVAHTGYESSKHFSQEDFLRIWKRKGSVYLVIFP